MDTKELDEQIGALRAEFAAKTGENEQIIQAAKNEEGTLVIEEKAREVFTGNLEAIRKARGDLELLLQQKDALMWGNAPERDPVALAAAAAQEGGYVRSLKSLGARFTDSEAFKEFKAQGFHGNQRQPFEVAEPNIGARYGQKDVYRDMPTGTPGSFGTIQRDPLVPMPQRQTRVRDLFPVQTTTAAVIEYFRVTGFTNAASVVPERNTANDAFSLKPQSGLAFEGQQTATRTIAHWEVAHRNALADEPQLRGIIDNELLYGLRLVEDDQILNGTGTGEDLLGVLNTSGIQTYPGLATPPPTDNKADAIRRAATLALLAFYEPTGVVVHPSDWEDMELIKDQNGQYLLAVSIALGGEPRVWRMPVVQTPAMAQGTALVGAFGLGSQLYDREASNIRIAEQHADFFIRNAVVILAEERLALATKRPESFVVVTF